MEGFIQELGSKKVLSREDIILLKKYVSKKHMNYYSYEKSDILANAIHQVLDKNIKGLNLEYNQTIKMDLLKNTILKNGEPILLLDIFNICVAVQDKSDVFFESLINWINFHVENKVSKVELEKYILKINNLNNASSIESNAIENDFVKENIEKIEGLELSNKYNFILKDLKEFCVALVNWGVIHVLCCFFLIIIVFSENGYKANTNFENVKVNINVSSSNSMEGITSENIRNNNAEINYYKSLTEAFPEYFKYKDINQTLLKKFLIVRNSLLAEEPYFSTIISVSKDYNLNPLVIFAIAGQEQSFVPKDDFASVKIGNNPFNVYHSWKEYNTSIYDSSRIVCMTIINLSKSRPKDEEPFHWIGKKYAEDQNWSKLVNKIYNKLEENNVDKNSVE